MKILKHLLNFMALVLISLMLTACGTVTKAADPVLATYYFSVVFSSSASSLDRNSLRTEVGGAFVSSNTDILSNTTEVWNVTSARTSQEIITSINENHFVLAVTLE